MKQEKPEIPNKPFSVLGGLILYKNGTVDILDTCLLCGKPLHGEPHYTCVWVEPDFERNYVYFLCENCFEKYMHDRPHAIEEKVMSLLATVQHVKLKRINDEQPRGS